MIWGKLKNPFFQYNILPSCLPVYSMKEQDIEKYRNKLLKIRSSLKKESDHLEKDVQQEMDQSEVTINHPADSGSDNYDSDFTLGQLEHANMVLIEVDDALRRIEDGHFGICEACDCKIPKTRLDVRPFASMCVSCQEKSERGEL